MDLTSVLFPTPSSVVVTTSIATFITGYIFGIYTIRGYLISPALSEERKNFYQDPVESEESDVDEKDTLLDHAPNWANSEEADSRDGLRARLVPSAKHNKKVAASTGPSVPDSNEECKLVLVVRTDLGMTKGEYSHCACFSLTSCLQIVVEGSRN
jgi:PTH2 family peptidyl-tRNA hydrolase